MRPDFNTLPASAVIALLYAGDPEAIAWWEGEAKGPREPACRDCGRYVGAGHCDRCGE